MPRGGGSPDQLIGWMKGHGFLNGTEAGAVPPTEVTINTTSFCWRSALREPHDVQVVGLNLVRGASPSTSTPP
jgi:hypothetical protein